MTELKRMAAEALVDIEIIPTHSPAELRQKVRALIQAGERRVAVAGGDGTVNLAVQELAHTGVTLGILPMGTNNNFAAALHLPVELPAAMRVLASGRDLQVGLGRVAGEYFTESAGVGLFADVLRTYGAGTNKDFVRGAYAILRSALFIRARSLRLTVDGVRHQERAVMITVANSYRIGPAFPVAPEASLTDNELDIVIVGNINLAQLPRYYRAFRSQTHFGLPKVSLMRGRTIEIECGRPIAVHCDDHVAGTTPVTITSEPAALRVRAPLAQE